jgi:sucrose-6F-phosphate phosphohydrolase
MQVPFLLASDIDNTLTGDETSLRRLAADLTSLRSAGQLMLFLSTGRRLEQVTAGFSDESIPVPDAIIGQVGTEIFLPPFVDGMAPMVAWDEHLHLAYERERALAFLDGIDGLVMQPDEFNTPLKVSCFLDEAPDPEAAAAEILRRVAEHGDGYQVVWSSGVHLDILPAASGKGRAIRFLIEHLGLEAGKVIVAGDSGNDRSMFDEFGCGIVVANAQAELAAMAGEPGIGSDIVFASAPYAAGVAEGLQRFGVLSE